MVTLCALQNWLRNERSEKAAKKRNEKRANAIISASRVGRSALAIHPHHLHAAEARGIIPDVSANLMAMFC